MKLIHCADIHLDSPMQTHMTARQASTRAAELLSSFVRMTQYARQNEVRAVIIAGDLFDGARVKERTIDAVLSAMRATPEVDYLYLPGNHDEAASAFHDRKLPENLKCFGNTWRTYCYDTAAISGRTLGSGDETLYEELPILDGHVNLVTLHGQLATACDEDQINRKLLEHRGIDYLALGHIHSYSLQRLDEKGLLCYSGCLEGRGFDECGKKGFVLLTVEHGRVEPEFVPFSCRTLHHVETDVTGCVKNAEIAARVKEASRGIPPDDMAEFLLTGEVSPEADISVAYLQNQLAGSYFFAKVKDETKLAIDPATYRNDVSLKGEFIRQVLGSDLSERDKAAIIRAGVSALAGEEVSL